MRACCGPHYRCSTCGGCYVHDHTSFFQHGRWFCRGPCGVKYAFPERPDLPRHGQVMVDEITFQESATRLPHEL